MFLRVAALEAKRESERIDLGGTAEGSFRPLWDGSFFVLLRRGAPQVFLRGKGRSHGQHHFEGREEIGF